MLHIDRALRKNRNLLSKISVEGKSHVSKSQLALRGFDFGHFTKVTGIPPACCYYCYDLGYRFVDEETVLIIVSSV